MTWRRWVVSIFLALASVGAICSLSLAGEGGAEPGPIIMGSDSTLTTPLITVTVNTGFFAPSEMAFKHDSDPFLPWEPFQVTKAWAVQDPERAYQSYLEALNGGSSFSAWDNEYGALAWGESFILSSLLDMYEATHREIYLEEFVAHADAVIEQGDDRADRPDYRNLVLPGWSTGGPIVLARTVFSNSLGQPSLEVRGRSVSRQNQIAVRLSTTSTATDTLWALNVHRSMPGRLGIVLSDTQPLVTAPDWHIAGEPDVLRPGDSLAYDLYYPWFLVSGIRLYGVVDGEDLSAEDFDLYTAMHTDLGEYTPVLSYTLQTLTEGGCTILDFRDMAQWGRYWKLRYVGESPLILSAEPGSLLRLYESGRPPLSEQFQAGDLLQLVSLVNLESNLVQLHLAGSDNPQPSYGWCFLTPQRYRMALHTGLITYPLLRFSALVEREGLTTWQPQSQEYLEYARAAVESHDDEWRSVSTTQGYYVYREDSPKWCNGVNLPYNQQAAMGRSLLLLYDLTQHETYRVRAMKIAQVLRDGFIYDPDTDSYYWHYWFGEGYEGWQDVEGRFLASYEGFKGREAIFYASIDVDFARMAYNRGMVFSYYDMIRLSNTFLNRLSTEEGELRCYVDGEQKGMYFTAERTPDLQALTVPGDTIGAFTTGCSYDDKMTAVEYLGLTEIVPAIYQRVEAIGPFPSQPKNSGRAPYGIAQLVFYATWRLSPQPGDHTLCIRFRDAHDEVVGPWCTEVTLNLWRFYLPVIHRGSDVSADDSPYALP